MAKKTSQVPKLVHFSDYLPPGSDNEQTHRARLFLIEATRRCVPEFLQELSTRVFPIYEELADSGYDFERIIWGPDAFKLLKDRGLKQALEDWAARFNAQVEWLMIGALRTMRAWRTSYGWRERLKWHTLTNLFAPVVAMEEFRYRPRDLTELWEDYFRGACEALMEYRGKTDEFAKTLGWKRARRQYSPINLEWFALYQLAGKSHKEIADRYSTDESTVDESTVLKGIKAAAKLLAWDHLREPDRHRKTR